MQYKRKLEALIYQSRSLIGNPDLGNSQYNNF